MAERSWTLTLALDLALAARALSLYTTHGNAIKDKQINDERFGNRLRASLSTRPGISPRERCGGQGAKEGGGTGCDPVTPCILRTLHSTS